MGFRIADRRIGIDAPPFVIAEMSGNHGRSLERALALVDAASDAGVDAIKLQTYTPDTMTLDIERDEFVISEPASLWSGRTLYDVYREACTPWEWHEPIMARARDRGLVCFSSPFDPTAVDFLEELDVPCYKIASLENVDVPLIRHAAATGKPMLISTGVATLTEIAEAVDAARQAGCPQVILLKCTTSYPASPDDSHLRTIPHMRELFGCEVGLSDHTLGIGVPIAAVALGAVAIEKHITLARSSNDIDAAFSLEPHEFASLVVESERAWRALGAVRYAPTQAEQAAVRNRRSLYVTEDLEAGDVLSRASVRPIRPGLGLPPKYYSLVLGRRVTRAVRRGTPLGWHLVGPPES